MIKTWLNAGSGCEPEPGVAPEGRGATAVPAPTPLAGTRAAVGPVKLPVAGVSEAAERAAALPAVDGVSRPGAWVEGA